MGCELRQGIADSWGTTTTWRLFSITNDYGLLIIASFLVPRIAKVHDCFK